MTKQMTRACCERSWSRPHSKSMPPMPDMVSRPCIARVPWVSTRLSVSSSRTQPSMATSKTRKATRRCITRVCTATASSSSFYSTSKRQR
ncbi:hypothetical protein SPRG_21142 [Saprolegnia parasitica CBS 223.65]|uniref:Uncharacterized protein n=1 Tax=Saprolegnia parasitica (strain CBS 223.65) TaxID=695850 RepID=A0A067C4W6_SAPPC|nr:hypothetical protein SPRG_21142 [Saprolegnia parasitica CBS 223.65]KDO21852.1 hypothetical protein SPRG_21142 [Saprolegnia parasitica CBS 223.65]|eukprot:XP_012207454.1 hypothetical protein SPRG_21142 [Saprolegnia parasitica CBS 223.65]